MTGPRIAALVHVVAWLLHLDTVHGLETEPGLTILSLGLH
jgi:hypothetical protein